jgi:hypothetical protein
MIIILVNGNWTEWNQWGACSLAYNTTNGTEIRERTSNTITMEVVASPLSRSIKNKE